MAEETMNLEDLKHELEATVFKWAMARSYNTTVDCEDRMLALVRCISSVEKKKKNKSKRGG